jgi:hypothetical protein
VHVLALQQACVHACAHRHTHKRTLTEAHGPTPPLCLQYYYRERGGLELFDLLDDPSPIACTNSGPPGTNGARGGAYLMPIGYSGLSEVAAQFISTVRSCGPLGGAGQRPAPCPVGMCVLDRHPCEEMVQAACRVLQGMHPGI